MSFSNTYISPRPPPQKIDGFLHSVQEKLFKGKLNGAISLALMTFALALFIPFANWALIDSVWVGDAQACRAGGGACWAFVAEKFRFILFGMYPPESQWRPLLCIFAVMGVAVYSMPVHRWKGSLFLLWAGTLLFSLALMYGGWAGLAYVENAKWGGLAITLLFSLVAIVTSYPIGILLALARTSSMPFMRVLSTVYIELIRGVPLISLLFMSSVMFPLFLPEGVHFDKLLRAQVALVMFSSAYMAEVVRGGLQSMDKGQTEAAFALGMSYPQTLFLIILPQALTKVIPPTVSTCIGIFKDTSLLIIIALFDLMYTTKASLHDSHWLGFSSEAYIFVALIYFFFCYSLSRYSRRLEESEKGHAP